MIYVDDSLLKGDSVVECCDNVYATKNQLEALGFTIHLLKSSMIPSQKITFLGFDIDTVRMTISITNRKKEKIYELCVQILSNNSTRELFSSL